MICWDVKKLKSRLSGGNHSMLTLPIRHIDNDDKDKEFVPSW